MKSRLSVLVVGATAVLSWWLLSTEQKKQDTQTQHNHYIDVFINNLNLTNTDKSGSVSYTLKADRLEHYNDEEHSQIINPKIQYDNHWLISAKFGEIDNKQNFIKLHDNVTMKKIESDEIFIISTQAMTINAKSKIIESDQSVNINSGAFKLKSNGMYFDGQKKQLKLLSSKVSRSFAP